MTITGPNELSGPNDHVLLQYMCIFSQFSAYLRNMLPVPRKTDWKYTYIGGMQILNYENSELWKLTENTHTVSDPSIHIPLAGQKFRVRCLPFSADSTILVHCRVHSTSTIWHREDIERSHSIKRAVACFPDKSLEYILPLSSRKRTWYVHSTLI